MVEPVSDPTYYILCNLGIYLEILAGDTVSCERQAIEESERRDSKGRGSRRVRYQGSQRRKRVLRSWNILSGQDFSCLHETQSFWRDAHRIMQKKKRIMSSNLDSQKRLGYSM